MTAQHDLAPILNQIHRAERRHGPIKDLRQQLVADVTEQLAFECSASHAVAMHVIALNSAIEGLCKIAAENEQGYELVRTEFHDLTSHYFKISLLLSALKARKA